MWFRSILVTTGKVRYFTRLLVFPLLTRSIQQRGYKVALALQFGSFVIAFLSQDLIFQVRFYPT
jgi:hypothetical protein